MNAIQMSDWLMEACSAVCPLLLLNDRDTMLGT